MPKCKVCNNTGGYMYDENRGKVCEHCCPHDEGRWLLSHAGYGTHRYKWACKRGCGVVWETEEGGEPWPGPTKEEREAYRRELFEEVYPLDARKGAIELWEALYGNNMRSKKEDDKQEETDFRKVTNTRRTPW